MVKMGLVPREGSVVIEKILGERKTEFGFLLLKGNAKVSLKVTATGVGVKNVKNGDVVICPAYSGFSYRSDDKEYLIIDAEDILAVVNEP